MTASVVHLGDVTRHFWLTRSVARAMDVSLAEAMDSGLLSAADYAGMVTRCRMCPHVPTCEAWLARFGATATVAPEHCSNAGKLNMLATFMRPRPDRAGHA